MTIKLLASSVRARPERFQIGFSTGRDSATFRDSGTGKTFLSWDKGTPGQKFLHCPGTKGQAKNLAKGRDGPGQPKFGTGRARTAS